MSLTRREFMKICSASVAGFGISQMFHPEVVRAISGSLDGSRPPVLWVKGLSCGSCTASLLSSSHPAVSDIFFKMMSLEFHPALMTGEGSSALSNLFATANEYRGRYFMVLEGAIPQAASGRYSMAGELDGREYSTRDLVLELAPRAAAVMAVGTCASYGGIMAAPGSPVQAVGLGAFMQAQKIRVPLVNIPGCAPRPDWIVGTLASTLELFAAQSGRKAAEELALSLDPYQRPLAFYENLALTGHAETEPGFPGVAPFYNAQYF